MPPSIFHAMPINENVVARHFRYFRANPIKMIFYFSEPTNFSLKNELAIITKRKKAVPNEQDLDMIINLYNNIVAASFEFNAMT